MLFFKRLFFNSFIVFNFTVSSFALNYKLLEHHADNINMGIWHKVSDNQMKIFNENELFDKLNFFDENDYKSDHNIQINKKIQPIKVSCIDDSFKTVENTVIERFNHFIETCNSLYDLLNQIDPSLTQPLNILFLRVKENFEDNMTKNRDMVNFLNSKTKTNTMEEERVESPYSSRSSKRDEPLKALKSPQEKRSRVEHKRNSSSAIPIH